MIFLSRQVSPAIQGKTCRQRKIFQDLFELTGRVVRARQAVRHLPCRGRAASSAWMPASVVLLSCVGTRSRLDGAVRQERPR
jgi:hypothetical protein